MSKFYVPPGVNYPSHTDPATNGRGPEVVIYPIHIRKANGFVIGVDSLLDVQDMVESGDMIKVYPGTYDIGDNSIQLKDGVNWEFRGTPTISSDSVLGTFSDNGVVVAVYFDGKVSIINTSKPYKVISLTAGPSEVYGYNQTMVVGLAFDSNSFNVQHNDFGFSPQTLDYNSGDPILTMDSVMNESGVSFHAAYWLGGDSGQVMFDDEDAVLFKQAQVLDDKIYIKLVNIDGSTHASTIDELLGIFTFRRVFNGGNSLFI